MSKKIIVGFMKIAQVTLVVAWWVRTPGSPGQLRRYTLVTRVIDR